MRRFRAGANRGSRIADGQSASASSFAHGARTRQKAERERITEAEPGGDDKTTEIAAVRLLARREHSTRELKRKLQGKGHAQESVDRIVTKLSDTEVVSDERFATAMVANHARRGHGPVRIRAELRQQGTPDDLIDLAVAKSDVDWSEIATAVRVRKFGSKRPSSMAERAKQSRFLQYRGFNTDQIRAAMTSVARDDGQSLSDSDLDLDSDPD